MHNSEYDLLEALAEPYCSICYMARRAARAYLEGVFADGINDLVVRDDWRRRGGLCSRHWQEVRELDSPMLSATILLQDLLPSRLAFLQKVLWRPPDCPACAVEAKAELRYLSALQQIPQWQVAAAWEVGKGFLCLKHLSQLPDGSLRSLFSGRIKDLLNELAELERKNDYRYIHEPIDKEGDSWLRAIRALGGEV
ncbi:MAG: hypothetical protein M1157_03935 [Deinococcus sp.]|nr:hypothetical protein [Deinococcus sp.]